MKKDNEGPNSCMVLLGTYIAPNAESVCIFHNRHQNLQMDFIENKNCQAWVKELLSLGLPRTPGAWSYI